MAPIGRRDLLKAGAALAAVSTLGSCALPGSDSGKPNGSKTGGTLRLGSVGQQSNIVRDPHQRVPNASDFLILSLIYDPLTVPGGVSQQIAPRLASKWTPDESQRVWKFSLADGATFHDGSPVTAEDAAWSLQRLFSIGGPARVPVTSEKDITIEGDQLVVTTPDPNRILPLLLRINSFTIKKGTETFSDAIGTGPFKLDTFNDGNARLVRNENWHGGVPRLDAIEVTRFDDVSALLNAVLSGAIDFASDVGAIAARSAQGQSNIQVIRRPTDQVVPIVMNTSEGPWADPQVREAVRLGVDRKAMVEHVYSGFAAVSNDVLGAGDPDYDKSLAPRTKEVAKAKSLLAQANFDTSATYQLFTEDVFQGEVQAAKAFATQMKDIGLNIDVVVQDSAVFTEKTWGQVPMCTKGWGTVDSVLFLATKYMISSSETNETGFNDAEFDAAVRAALGASDDATYVEAVKKVQKIEYDRGGYVAYGVADGIDIASSAVKDAPKLGGLGRLQFEKTWMSGAN